MAENTKVSGLEFEVKATGVTKATNSLKKLTDALSGLKQAGGGDTLSKIARDMSQIGEANKEASTSGLTKLNSALKTISNKASKLETVVGALREISTLDFSNLTGASEVISNLASVAKSTQAASRAARNASDTANNVGMIGKPVKSGNAGSSFGSDQTEKAERSATGYTKVLSALGRGLKSVGKDVTSLAKKFAKLSASLIAVPFKKVANQVSRFVNKLKGVGAAFARIAYYRIIRTLIKEIGQAFRDGTNNLYQWSKAVDGKFAASMDKMATSLFYLKNSLGAMVSPILNALAPALDLLVDKFVTLINVVNQFFAALSGSSTWTRAIKVPHEYAEAAEEAGQAAKEAMKYIAPFDELNVLPSDKASGSSGNKSGEDFSTMFEELPVTSKIADFAKWVKEQIKNGDWQTLGTFLGDKFNEMVDNIKWGELGTKVGKGIGGFVDTAYYFLRTANGTKLGRGFADFFNNALSNINFSNLGGLLVRGFTFGIDVLIGFIQGLDPYQLYVSIRDFISGAFTELRDWLGEHDWSDIGSKFNSLVISILDGIKEGAEDAPWEEIGQAIGDFLGEIEWVRIFTTLGGIIWDAISGMLDGLLSTEDGKVFVGLAAGLVGLKLAFTTASPILLKAAGSLVTEVGSKLVTSIGAIAAPVATAALGVADAILLMYDVKSLESAYKTYDEANQTHQKETETALDTYKELYETKGKEVADEWAKMVYDIDLTGKNMDESQKALSDKIDSYWNDVPQNMWQGFKQGWDSYFGENGTGLISLLEDAFTGAVDGIKTLLGIHSPSTVFSDIGKDIVQGLIDGFEQTWTTFKTGLETKWNSLKNWWSNLSLPKFKIPLPHFRVSGSFSISTKGITTPSIGVDWYAKGGIVDGATLIGAGEAGKEAIVPLERNTEWISKVAGQLNDQMGSGDIAGDLEQANGIIVTAIYSAANQIVRAMDGKGSGIDLETLSRQITDVQVRRSRATGMA